MRTCVRCPSPPQYIVLFSIYSVTPPPQRRSPRRRSVGPSFSTPQRRNPLWRGDRRAMDATHPPCGGVWCPLSPAPGPQRATPQSVRSESTRTAAPLCLPRGRQPKGGESTRRESHQYRRNAATRNAVASGTLWRSTHSSGGGAWRSRASPMRAGEHIVYWVGVAGRSAWGGRAPRPSRTPLA